MDNLAADFIINLNNPIEAEFELGETEHFDCSFELFASGTVWSIDGDISNQTDLKNALDSKADITTVNELSGNLSNLTTTVNNNYTELDGRITQNHNDITSLSQTLQSYGDIVTYDAADFATAAQGILANTALQPGDNITELVNNAGYITSADLPTLEDLTTQAQMNAINSGATSVNIAQIASNTQAISTETLNRQNADNGLQSQIDAIVASSDVFDIIGTYAELQAYDISTVPLNDIIKVLVDSTHNNAATYYRCVETGEVKSWSYIGSEGAYYTKSEADGRFVPQTRTINGKALSNNITLDAIDVGALPSSTVIPTVNNGTLTIQVNGTSVGTFTANQSGNTTANIVVPDSATWGNITGDIENQTDLQDALDDKQDKLTTGTDLEIVVGSGSSNTVSGTNSIILSNASANSLSSVIVYGKCSQTGTPTTSNPIDIVCNNGTIKYNTGTSSFYTEGTVETVTDSLNNTATAEMLLGFGDYIDTQDLLGVGGTRKVGLMVLTGTEEFNTTTLTNCYSLESALGDGNLTDRTVYCTHFQHASTLPAAGSRQGYALIGNRNTPSNSYTVGFGATTQFSTVALFKSWLATQYANGTPVIIAYPLATPTTFGATAQTLNTKSGSNQLTITQSAISNLNIKATYTTDSTSTINFTNDSGYIKGINSTDVTTALGYTPVNPSSLATVATSGDYDDLTNKPIIPTVGDGTITITQGGVTKGTFTTNQSGNSTIALDAGGSGGIQNTATGTDSLTILGTASSADYSVNIGVGSEINADDGVAIGCEASTYSGVAIGRGAEVDNGGCVAIGKSAGVYGGGDIAIGDYAGVNGTSAIALGYQASATASNAIQIGNGSNTTANTLRVGNYTLLDTSTGLIPDARLSSNVCTTNTAQNISGRKTFLGEKAIYFKQSATTDKLGFTLYNSSNTELGAFEWRPNTISGGALLNINVPYSSSNYVGFRYWGTAVNIIAPKVATAGNYYIPTHITDGNTTVTASSNGTVNISSLLPNVSGYLENTATGTDSLTILGTPATDGSSLNIGYGSATSYDGCIAIGSEDSSVPVNGAISADMSVAIGSGYDVHNGAYADGVSVAVGTGSEAISGSVAVGYEAKASSGNNTAIGVSSIANGDWGCVAIGDNAEATAVSAIQIGSGTNNVASTLQIGNKQLLSLTTGLIPDARLSSNIARTSQIPTVPTNISSFTNDSGYITSASLPTMTYTSATETLTFG